MAIYTITVHQLAEEDILQSVIWYKERSTQAAANFQNELRNVFQKIVDSPFSGRNRYKNNYELQMKKYPFTVVYMIVDKGIIISAVYHSSRNPKNKYRDL